MLNALSASPLNSGPSCQAAEIIAKSKGLFKRPSTGPRSPHRNTPRRLANPYLSRAFHPIKHLLTSLHHVKHQEDRSLEAPGAPNLPQRPQVLDPTSRTSPLPLVHPSAPLVSPKLLPRASSSTPSAPATSSTPAGDDPKRPGDFVNPRR